MEAMTQRKKERKKEKETRWIKIHLGPCARQGHEKDVTA